MPEELPAWIRTVEGSERFALMRSMALHQLSFEKEMPPWEQIIDEVRKWVDEARKKDASL